MFNEGITVRDAMEIGGLTKCRVVAGAEGLDRPIQHVTIMEVPDIIQWLKGNDLLLTSLYSIKDSRLAIEQLVSQLDAKGSSALAIKKSRFVESIPDVIIEEGNRLRFPIIEIDSEVAYLDIMTPLMYKIINSYLADYVNLEPFYRWITELAMSGKGIHATLAALEKLMGNPVTVESEIPQIESVLQVKGIEPLTAAQKQEIKSSNTSLLLERSQNGNKVLCLVTPLLLNEAVYGYVTCWKMNKEFREIDFMILERSIPLIALEFLKVKTKLDVEQNYKDDFLNDVLSGNIADPEEVIDRAQSFGWDFAQDYQVMVVEADQIAMQHRPEELHEMAFQELLRKMLNKIKYIFSYSKQEVIAGIRRGCIVVLYPAKNLFHAGGARMKEEVDQLASRVREMLRQEFNQSFSVGYGMYHPGLKGIYAGYNDANTALQLGRILHESDFHCHFDDLRLYRILAKFPDKEELASIYRETIGKLVSYDQENDSGLTETLSTYFSSSSSSLTETAKKMFVHVNTIKYRLQKIEELTGCSINNPEDRLWLHTGLKIQHTLYDKSGNPRRRNLFN